MLTWTVKFFILALVAAVFGFGGIASGAMELGRICFFIFVVLFLISFLTGRKIRTSI